MSAKYLAGNTVVDIEYPRIFMDGAITNNYPYNIYSLYDVSQTNI